MEDTQDEGKCRHRLLTTGQQQHILQPFSWWLCDNVDARLQNIVCVDQAHFSATATEQFLEELTEILVDVLERMSETFTRPFLNFAQGFIRGRNTVDDVLALNGKKQ